MKTPPPILVVPDGTANEFAEKAQEAGYLVLSGDPAKFKVLDLGFTGLANDVFMSALAAVGCSSAAESHRIFYVELHKRIQEREKSDA
jgi:hypothetical protein